MVRLDSQRTQDTRVIDIIVYRKSTGVSSASFDDVPELLTCDDCIFWVDVTDPTEAEVREIGETFNFHPLALEDTLLADIRPKIDQYDDYFFIAFYGMTSHNGDAEAHSVDIFLSKHYMVTFHDSKLPVVEETAGRWKTTVATEKHHGCGFLLYSLLDALVDGYFPVIDDIVDRAEELEEQILSGGAPALQAQILRLRRDLLMIRRVVGPERDVLNILLRRDPPILDAKETIYFQDIYDHLLRIMDTIDISRDVLSSVLDANVSMISYNLNVVVKRLTSSSIILMSITLIAGIYGMNFDVMPELAWRYGYLFALGLMALTAVVEIAIFRRIDWL